MITATNVTYRTSFARVLRRLAALLRAPFTHVYAAPIWLALRLYLGWMWFGMGAQKLAVGFLSSDPIGPILHAGADGILPMPWDGFRPIAGLLVQSGLTPLISWSMPWLELAVALAFVSGVLVVPAAVGATLLNVVFVLSGIGQIQLDGRFIALQLLLIAAYRVVGTIGVERLVRRVLVAAVTRLRRRRAAHSAT